MLQKFILVVSITTCFAASIHYIFLYAASQNVNFMFVAFLALPMTLRPRSCRLHVRQYPSRKFRRHYIKKISRTTEHMIMNIPAAT